MKTLELKVSEMSCGGCANSVRAVLSQELSVDKDQVEVSVEDGKARVKSDAEPTSEQVDSALKALKEQGFPASVVGGRG